MFLSRLPSFSIYERTRVSQLGTIASKQPINTIQQPINVPVEGEAAAPLGTIASKQPINTSQQPINVPVEGEAASASHGTIALLDP